MSTSSAPSATPAQRLPRILSFIVAILGLVMIIAGIAVYAVTSSQLRSQNISVAAVTTADPGSHSGDAVAGPITALAQINAVKHHVASATEAVNNGTALTFGQMKQVATSNGYTYNADVTTSIDGQAHQKGDVLSDTDASYYGARWTAQQGAFTISSLMTSVLAFGVAVLILGIGIVVLIVGIVQITTLRAAAPALPAKE
jgi:hypothetical protein